MAYDWTMFFDEYAGDFHPTFQKELSRQLYLKGDNGTNIKQFDKYGFQLSLGMRDLNKRVDGGKIIASIDFITPTSFSIPVDINWYSDKYPNLQDLHKQDITDLNVVFDWNESFPVSKILPHIKPYRSDKKAKTKLNFDVEYYYYLLPDICLEFHFMNPIDKGDQKSLDAFFSDFSMDKDNQEHNFESISHLTLIENNVYQIIMDIGVKNGIKAVTKILKGYSEAFQYLPTIKIVVK